MTTQVAPFTISFPEWYDERAEFEFASKGYLPGVEVQIEDATRYSLFFYDPVRLQQDLEAYASQGRPYYAEPGLVVVPEVNREVIQRAVAGLWQDGFFQHLKPIR